MSKNQDWDHFWLYNKKNATIAVLNFPQFCRGYILLMVFWVEAEEAVCPGPGPGQVLARTFKILF